MANVQSDTLTPYQRHKTLSHVTTWYSPDGYQKIEECTQCLGRWLHDPSIGYPITLYPERITIID